MSANLYKGNRSGSVLSLNFCHMVVKEYKTSKKSYSDHIVSDKMGFSYLSMKHIAAVTLSLLGLVISFKSVGF